MAPIFTWTLGLGFGCSGLISCLTAAGWSRDPWLLYIYLFTLIIGAVLVWAPGENEKRRQRGIGLLFLSFFAGIYVDQEFVLLGTYFVLGHVILWYLAPDMDGMSEVSGTDAAAFALAMLAATAPIRMLSRPDADGWSDFYYAMAVTAVLAVLAWRLRPLPLLPRALLKRAR